MNCFKNIKQPIIAGALVMLSHDAVQALVIVGFLTFLDINETEKNI